MSTPTRRPRGLNDARRSSAGTRMANYARRPDATGRGDLQGGGTGGLPAAGWAAVRKLWDAYYSPYIRGYFGAYGRFARTTPRPAISSPWSSSTSGAAYFPRGGGQRHAELYHSGRGGAAPGVRGRGQGGSAAGARVWWWLRGRPRRSWPASPSSNGSPRARAMPIFHRVGLYAGDPGSGLHRGEPAGGHHASRAARPARICSKPCPWPWR